MHWLTDIPIRRKLALITVLSSVIVLILAGSTIVGYEVNAYRAQKTQEIEVQAEILAASVTPALVFNDAKTAQEYLNALNANTDIAEAAIYGSDGALFTNYSRSEKSARPLPARAQPGTSHFEGDDLIAYAPIREGQKQLGFIYLRMNTEPLTANLLRNGGIILLVMLCSLLLTLPVSMRLHAIIANPIRDIAEAAKQVASGEIVVRQLTRSRKDEIGMLEEKFNQMALSLQEKASAAKQISMGDLSIKVVPQSEHDVLGNAFVGMMADLREKAELATRIAAGDLTVEARPRSPNDVLGNAFSTMVDKLRNMIRAVIDGVKVLAGSTSEILAGTSQLSESASRIAAAIAETTTTVEEVKQTTLLTNQKARNVSDAAQKATVVSREGLKAVEDSIEGMLQIREQMQVVAERIVLLSQQSQAIGEIIATVNDLSEQSNLLAVNASIEAAKAGDQGKGFAVVAQEVRSLSEQSKHATAQVRSLLGDIQKATGSAVLAAEQSTKAVEVGTKQSKDAGKAISQLADSITESAHAAAQIAVSTQQQLAGMDQLGTAMENIRAATQQNAQSTKQAELAANGLHDVGQKLRFLVEQYKT